VRIFTPLIFFFSFLSQLFPEAECLVKAAKLNREGWTTADVLFAAQWLKGGHELLSDPDLDEQVTASMKH
jgi:hypothetical protein